MGSKWITLTMIIHMIILLISALLAGLLTAWYREPWYLLVMLPVPLTVFSILHTFNQSNRQIAFFFEAIRNEDSSLKFPTDIRQRSLRFLYRSLNELNNQIRDIKQQNAYLEKYYQSFIQHADTGLMAINGNNEVEVMNEKAAEYAGIPSFIPLHLVPLKNPELFRLLLSMASGETLTYNRQLVDRPMNLLIRMKEIRYGGTASRLFSLQDIRQELEEKELDSWQKLIRVLTHEIMNSIAPIVSLSGTLRKFFVTGGGAVSPETIDTETIENVIQGLDTIEERGNGLLNFVNGYRKLTRIPIPGFEPIQVKEWLEQIRMLMGDQLAHRRIQVQWTVDPKAQTITGDAKLLTQVLINILNNAMEALDERETGRMIAITVGLSKQNRPFIRIANNGPCIPDAVAEKIFIPFFTTKEQGTGIGLSLSRQILRLHQGSLHVETGSEETAFLITL